MKNEKPEPNQKPHSRRYKRLNRHQLKVTYRPFMTMPDVSFLGPRLIKAQQYEEIEDEIIQYGNVFDKDGKFLRRQENG